MSSTQRKLIYDPISGEIRDKITLALVGYLDGKDKPEPSPEPEPSSKSESSSSSPSEEKGEEKEESGSPTEIPSEPTMAPSEIEPPRIENWEEETDDDTDELKDKEDLGLSSEEHAFPRGIGIIDIELPYDERRRNIYDPRNWVLFSNEEDINKISEIEKSSFIQRVDDAKRSYDERYEHNFKHMTTDIWSKSKLKSILKDNETRREIGNKESGLLDLKKLHRIVTTGKVFKKRALMTDKKYSVVLLVDCSGSMGNGNKIEQAAMATIKFIQEYSEYVDIEVIGFSRSLMPLKHFDEPVTKDMLKEIYFLILSSMGSSIANVYNRKFSVRENYGGNHDHLALQMAEKKLLKQTGQKFMVIFSDGEPSCGGCRNCRGMDLHEALIQEAKRIESSEIKLFSVGIMHGGVKKYYKNNKVIQHVSELSRTLIDLIGSQIKRLAVRG